MSRNSFQQIPRTQQEGLRCFDVSTLKTIAKLLPDPHNLPTRKDDLIDLLVRHSVGNSIFNHLSEMEKKALAETAHNTGGIYDQTRFMARYGRTPFPASRDYHRQTTLLNLFIIDGVMPLDLQARVKKVLPKPASDEIVTVDTLPRKIIQFEKSYNQTDEITVEVRERETTHEALDNFQIVLRLIDSGSLRISSTTRMPTGAAKAALAGQLACKDWYSQPCYDGIQTFAWPLLMQAGGFAAASSTKLILALHGKKVLTGKIPVHDAIRDTWNAWKTKALLDEFSRINVIKGQKSKGRVMTSASQRRATIIEALSGCPEGKWIAVEELGRHMRAENRSFSITHDSWSLYIGEKMYGSLGYEGFDSWEIFQERYLKVLIMEYAATLGIVDIGYAPPEEVAVNYSHLWGTEDLEYLSRYDGLLFFRVNDLGSYVLGNRKTYVPALPEVKQYLNVLPNFDIVVADGAALSGSDRLFLDVIAKREGDYLWKLSRQTLADALEKGENAATIRTFLSERAKNRLPQTVDVLLQESKRKIARCCFKGRACLLECSDRDIITLIGLDTKLSRYALTLRNSLVVLLPGQEEAFFKRIKELGYSVPVAREIIS